MKTNFIKKGIALVLVLVLAFCCAACKKADDSSNELTFWMDLNPTLSTKVSDFGETPLAKEIEKQTGIKVKYEHPAQGQMNEAFNLILASGKLPDIMRYDFYTLGAEKMMDNGTILDLTPYLESGKMPNLKKLLDEHPEWDAMIKTDDGRYYCFPFFRDDKSLLMYQGPIVRQDWLDELGMEMPETVEEWEEMLVAFKNKKGAKVPLAIYANDLKNGFIGPAYGIYGEEYVDGGKVRYAPMEDGYEDYLRLLNKWYKMGLIDANIASVTNDDNKAKIYNGESGANFAPVGSGIGTYLTNMKDKDSKFNMVAAPYPVVKKGDKPQYSVTSTEFSPFSSCVISAKSKHIDEAIKFLDYAYSPEGQLLYNFGVEGVSYEMVDGEPKFTQHMVDIVSGKNQDECSQYYSMGVYSGPFVQMKSLVDQTLVFPQQVDAYDKWFIPSSIDHKIPPVQYTDEEKERRTNILRDIATLNEEKLINYVTGRESIDTLGAYRQQLKSMGIDELLKIDNAAYQRYLKR